MKRAFAAMDRIKKDLVFVKEPALHQEVLLSGDFAMCLCYNGRAGAAAAQGADFGVIWDKSFSLWDGLYIVKGSPNADAANAFLNYVATDPMPQAKFAELTAYGSTQLDSKPSIDGALGHLIPGPHAAEIGEPFLYDPKWWTDNGPKAYEEWTAYTAG
jgi:putative spermidine/putrescine transport system substrate-binding protein